MSIGSMMSSNHLILCHPLLLLPSIFSRLRVFPNESTLCIRWPKYWSFKFSISPSNEYSGLISSTIDWFDLLAVQGTLKSLLQHHSSKGSILWCSAFFMIQLTSVHDYRKNCRFGYIDLGWQSDAFVQRWIFSKNLVSSFNRKLCDLSWDGKRKLQNQKKISHHELCVSQSVHHGHYFSRLSMYFLVPYSPQIVLMPWNWPFYTFTVPDRP